MSDTGSVKAGDMLSLYYRYDNTNYTQSLHMVMEDSSNLTGVKIKPNIRIMPQAGQTPVAYFGINRSGTTLARQNAVSIFRLEDDYNIRNTNTPDFTNISFSFVEAF